MIGHDWEKIGSAVSNTLQTPELLNVPIAANFTALCIVSGIFSGWHALKI